MITAFAIMSAAMIIAYIAQWRQGNANLVDVLWSYGVGAAGVFLALSHHGWRAGAICLVIAIWSLRLGSTIARRNLGSPEDARYAKFRRAWQKNFQIKMFAFLQLQAVVALPLLLGINAATSNPAPLALHDALALTLALAAIFGEATADSQLRQFRATHPNGAVCDSGLWSRSRHPNYFFEFLGWCALPLFACPDHPATAAIAPLTIYILLVYVSGIPPLEAHMLASRGEAFRAYQARTPAFFPRISR